MFTTPYSKEISRSLRKGESNGIRVLDLFAGCGGLALGFEAVGFETIGFELDPDFVQSYQKNVSPLCFNVSLDREYAFPKADVVIGGPPCQPFSVGGHQLGIMDSRDGFPAFIHAVESVKPRLWMFENVRGLLYQNKWYLEKVVDRLARLGYSIEIKLLNAANYDVPQRRERLVVVGHTTEFSFPDPRDTTPTALDALGDFFKHEPPDGKYLTASMDRYVAKYEKASHCINPRDLRPDQSSRTLTCRNLAGATGDMMRLVVPSGRRRRLLPREAARLQSFPDWFDFVGSKEKIFKQIGNAVPPMMSLHLARAVLAALEKTSKTHSKRPKRNASIPIQIPMI
jgi:DNA (cytosine-5)-methyltransferase 1